jgi:4-hydroxybenzoate polyprenyltransferase
MPHTDITIPKWLEPYSLKIRAYAHLMRLDRPIGTWLLLLPGWWAIALAAPARLDLFILFGIGAVVMRGAGCVVNDLWDQNMDAAVERTRGRPLVTGAVGRREAFGLLGVLLLIGFLILISMPAMAIEIGVLSLAFVVTYPLMKRFTWWPQLFLGFTFNFGALLGWAAATGGLAWNAIILYGAGIFWTLGYDTIYAHQDKDDDAMVGIKSTARLLGGESKKWVALFYATATVLLALALPWPANVMLIVPAAHFAWQVVAWDMADPASSLRFFKSNRDAGLLILLIIFLFS